MKTKIFILAIFTIISFSLKSQNLQLLNDTNIIMHDYDPDTVLYGGLINRDSLRIDINSDGVLDFRFYYQPFSGGLYFYVGSLNVNCTYHNFNFTDTISLNNSTIIWNSGNMFWDNFTLIDRMFGIKLHLGSDFFYGWIHAIAGHTKDATITIDKYAFCKLPNYPFHLGQTEIITGVQNIIVPDSTNIYLINSGNNLIVESGKIIKSVTITSAAGFIVIWQDNINALTANINVGGIAHGAYVVQVQFDDLSYYTKQIVK